MKTKPASSSPRLELAIRVFSSLFLIPFVAIPAFMLYVGFWKPYVASQDQQRWVSTPCHIVSVDVEQNHGKNGVNYVDRIGFSYRVNDVEYRRTQRSGSYRERGQGRFCAQYPKGSKRACFVDPKNPARAVLTRAATPLNSVGLLVMAFPLAFMGIGLAIMVRTLLGVKPRARRGAQAATAATAATDGGVPVDAGDWTDRADWAAGRVVSTTKKNLLGIGIFTTAWNAISWPVAYGIMANERQRAELYFVLLFPVIGLGVLLWFMRMLMGYLKYGESVFEMATVPAAIGGTLEGKVQLQRSIRPTGPVTVRLNCLRISRNNKSESSENLVWQREEKVEMDDDDTIPVAVFIPEDCQPTASTDSYTQIVWRLEVKAPVAGIPYSAQFDVPVFAVALSPAEQAEAGKVRAHEQEELAHYSLSADSPIRVGPSDDGGMEFYFPAARNPGAAAIWTLISGVMGVPVWLLYSRSHGLEIVPGIVMSIVFGLLALLCGYSALGLWFGKTWVVANRDGLTITTALLGLRRVRTIAAADIGDIKTKIGMSAGQSAFYDIKVCYGDGQEAYAGSAIPGNTAADWLVAEMKKALSR